MRAIVSNASISHVLGNSNAEYVEGFINAFENVHTGDHSKDILQHKFFLPDESRYSNDAYYQSASELSVANHIRKRGVEDFAVNKNVNPTNGTNVDVHFRIGTTVDVEVKCPVEPELSAVTDVGNPVLVFRPAGRPEEYPSEALRIQREINASGRATAILGKNKDATLKSFLVEASNKFNPTSSVDNLNVLFIAGGSWGNMGESYMCLCSERGLFTATSFHPSSEFELVDIVMLSNLKYRHEYVRASQDWTLTDVLMVPFINSYGRKTRMSEATFRGLSVFDHHLDRFTCFTEEADTMKMPPGYFANVKLNHYIHQRLSAEEKTKYFPVNVYCNKWP